MADSIKMSLNPSPANLEQIFCMVIFCASDSWRRFVDEFNQFPYQTFKLATCDLPDFCMLWDTFQEKRQTCVTCFDTEFSLALLNAFPHRLESEPDMVRDDVCRQVQLLLQDVCTYCPVSSDQVELRNGQCQLISSGRGSRAVKKPKAAREAQMLYTVVRQHELVKNHVEHEAMPPRKTTASILKRCGMSSKNKFSKVRDSCPSIKNLFWPIT